jgi:hypothetical protein
VLIMCRVQVGTVCYACWADALNWIVLLVVLAVVLAVVVLIIKRSGNARSRTMGVRYPRLSLYLMCLLAPGLCPHRVWWLPLGNASMECGKG